MTHASVRGTELAVPENVVRLSVGIEDVDDLLADLDRDARAARSGIRSRTGRISTEQVSLLPTVRDGRMPQNERVTSTRPAASAATAEVRGDDRRRRAPRHARARPRHPRSTSRRCSAPASSCCPGSRPTPRARRRSSPWPPCSCSRSRSPARSRRSPRATPTRAASRPTCAARSATRPRAWPATGSSSGCAFGAPVVAVLGGEYVVAVLGVDRAAVPIIGFAVFVPPFVANWFGVRVAGCGAARAHRRCSSLVVVGVVAVTFPAVDASQLRAVPAATAGRASALAISLFVWAFAGWEAVTHIAGEFRTRGAPSRSRRRSRSSSSASPTSRCSS